jgi:hypothetical protein
MFRATSLSLSPLIRKYGTVFTPSGLSAACDEPFGREHWIEKLRVERLSREEWANMLDWSIFICHCNCKSQH